MSEVQTDTAPSKVMDASTFNVEDFLKSAVTLPEDHVTLYTDGATAWEIAQITDRIAKIHSDVEMANAAARSAFDQEVTATVPGPRSIADQFESQVPTVNPTPAQDAELVALEVKRTKLIEILRDSGVVVHMKALLPKVLDLTMKETKRRTNEHFKDEATPSEEERVEYGNMLFDLISFKKAVTKIILANGEGDEIRGPFTEEQLDALRGSVDSDEWSKVTKLFHDLNTRAVIRTATVDAGFPS